MIEVVLAFPPSGWKDNRCAPLPKMTASELRRRPGEQSLVHAAPGIPQRLGGPKTKARGACFLSNWWERLLRKVPVCPTPLPENYTPRPVAQNNVCGHWPTRGLRAHRGFPDEAFGFMPGVPLSLSERHCM